ncbi:MAG: response regulator transcription factor [Ignavibacteriaceae bacterium]
MNVLIADDHAIVREGIKQFLIGMGNVNNVQEASDGNEALSKIENEKYDFVVLDISMPGMSGLDILQELKIKDEDAHILILSMHPEEQYAVRALKLGASGYLCKDSVYEELAEAIEIISKGGRYITASLAKKVTMDKIENKLPYPHENLSDREFQVMLLIAEGKSLKEISEELCLSDKTISTYRTRILEKMDMSNNAEIIRYAINNKLIE